MSKTFTRTIEDFTCENCSFYISGNGYTNHCPKCLYSKHVDIYPGDRQEPCQGLMKPIGIEISKTGYNIIHKCLKCAMSRKNKAVDADNYDLIIELSTRPVAK